MRDELRLFIFLCCLLSDKFITQNVTTFEGNIHRVDAYGGPENEESKTIKGRLCRT